MNMENDGSSVAAADKPSETVGGWVESVVVTVSQTSVGQTLLKFVDRFLWVVEKSAQWSLPCPEVTTEENGKSFGKMELVRPLPWVFFLPGLVILRVIRGTLNVGAFVLGLPQVQPSGMVKFVQKGRRRLRAMNLKAVKNIRRKTYGNKAGTPEEKSPTESAESSMQAETKRKFSQVSSDAESSDESQDEKLEAKIDRLAMEDSSDDPDFNVADCSTETSTGSSENEEAEANVSLTELQDITKDRFEHFRENTVTTQSPRQKMSSSSQIAVKQTISATAK